MAGVAPVLLLLYYVCAFLLEEDLLLALLSGGLTKLRRDSRLLTREFCVLYYPIIVYFFCFWLPAAGDELVQACQRNADCRRHLRVSPWSSFFVSTTATTQAGKQQGLLIDLADIQWRDFRGSLWLLLPAAALLALLVRLLTHAAATLTLRLQKNPAGSCRIVRPNIFIRLVFGAGFLLYVHGAGAFLLLSAAVVFCITAKASAGSPAAVPLAWALALLLIVAKDPRYPIRPLLTFETLLGSQWRFLDGDAFRGEYDWAESVNLMVLRLLSFSLDCHRAVVTAVNGRSPKPEEAAGTGALELVGVSRFSMAACFSHAFYAPLFIAGPTICFDDYFEQCVSPAPRPQALALGLYLAQLGFGVAALEVGTHLYPCFALARSGALAQLTPRLGAAAVFLTLNLMWLKFLVIWRVARGWALADGIDPPENMRRALCDHYSVASFWQCWHSSYNRWLVKYIYVPAGGRQRRIFATALVFMFVAIWHDIEAKLLAWGALNGVFIALETTVGGLAGQRLAPLASRMPWVHRQLCALGGTTCIFLLMAVNMIGYSVGIGGLAGLLGGADSLRGEALRAVLGAYVVLFCGVQVMLEVRSLDGTFSKRDARKGSMRSEKEG
eukprot:TRINITY_DN80180_c0_g1_i1.p1 TRINITY_DN80180_c0_g1~~TRINITY_DN80180_c0_g1_i1.p1  ORF type:complete len:611 (+),score=110.02 TRINITY_DN80180_c0_g1_i1:66-1898(+)